MEKSIGNYIESAIDIFSSEVNKNRQLPLVYDGLKPAYRRLICTALKNGDKFAKVSAITGLCISTLHPHGSDALEQPVSNMVRWGIMDGHGNHGAKTLRGDDIDKSAARYISAKLSDQYIKFFSELMPYVPYIEAELEGNEEPLYLPTPYPLCLTHGTLGIGQGVNCRIPAFTLKSLHEAYINDNPNLLKGAFGLDIDYDDSELQLLWNTGLGNVTYKMKVWADSSPAGYGVYLKGSAELHKPHLGDLERLESEGKIFIIDNTDEEGSKLFFGRNYNIKSVNYDQIIDLVNAASIYKKTYRLTVADFNNVYLIPLKKWLDFTYTNYIKLVEVYKQDKIKTLEFNYQVYTWLPKVVEVLMSDRSLTASDIASKLMIDKDIVSSILGKTINTLRHTDSTAKLESISNQINYFKNLDPHQKIQSVIDEL